MRRVEVEPGRYVNVADDATDDEVAALVAAAQPQAKVRTPESASTKETKAPKPVKPAAKPAKRVAKRVRK